MTGARWLISVLIAALVFAPHATAQADRGAVFPFAKGTVWTYAGTVRWTNGRNRPERRDVRWTSEVVDAFDRGDAAGVLLHGGVWDLAWWSPSSRPADYAVLRAGSRYYLITSGARRSFAAVKASGRAALPTDLRSDVWFDVPLRPGAVLRASDVAPRADTMYGWRVARAAAGVVVLTYTTLPDEERVTLVPGVGVTAFAYRHHGTVAEADVRLVDVHLARSRPVP